MASTTNPSDWFLPEIPSSDGNTVTPLVDGENYFAELKNTMEGLSTNSYLHISGWRLNPATSIDPANSQSMQELVTGVLSGGNVTARSMLWFVPGTIGNFGAGHGPENVAFTDFITDQGGEAILDNRLPNGRFASHHQKFMVMGSDAGHAAFVGGIDIAPDRWDTNQHDDSDLREPELFRGWHDIQIKVEGPAVGHVWDTFQDRWNDPRRPHNFPASGRNVPTPIDIGERPDIAASGTHSVQLLKTFACKSNAGDGTQSPYPFAPSGLYSYKHGLVRAIENAEHYVYVEDQYFWPCAATVALADAVARGVKVILVLTRDYDVTGLVPYHNFLRNQAIQGLRDEDEDGDKVFVYHLELAGAAPRDQIYVHAKTWIIDDRYMLIGSANVNRRSLTTDTELGVAVVDTDAVSSTIGGSSESVSRLARAYRQSLWSEHLGTTAQEDPFNSNGRPAGFPTNNSLVGHIRKHEVAQPRFCELNIIPFGLMNSKTTCG